MKCLQVLCLAICVIWVANIGKSLTSAEQQFLTVYYGVPVWKNATPPLFCATMARDQWSTSQCVPSDPQNLEVPVNLTEYFDVYKNYMVDHIADDMDALFLTATKPCTKLTPMCVRMACTDITKNLTGTVAPPTTNSTTNSVTSKRTNDTNVWWGNNATEPVYNCTWNMTGGFRDKKYTYFSHWYLADLMKEPGNGNDSYYYATGCNLSVIAQACEKTHYQAFPIQYCAPAGFALIKCNDNPWTGRGKCHNISAVHCTDPITTIAATWLVLNGTKENQTQIIHQAPKNESAIILLGKEHNITIQCIRPGNRTIKDLQIAAGLMFHSQIIAGKDLKRAYCKIEGNWTRAMEDVNEKIAKAYKDHINSSSGTAQIRWQGVRKGDLEVSLFWHACQGEFFYCNISSMFMKTNYTYNYTAEKGVLHQEKIGRQEHRYSDRTKFFMSCQLRQMINRWSKVEKLMYLPPREGHLSCKSNVTGILVDINHYKGNDIISVEPSSQIRDAWRAAVARYKVIEITPIGFAPTNIRRYDGPATKEKRAAPLALGFIGFLSTAGTAMGAVATALTVQSRSLLSGIVQQQEHLLRAIEHQQHLLQLTVWGIKNLNARLTALEKYLEDQARLNSWGCAWKQICYTSVPWNKTWTNSTNPDWQNMTWQEWEKLVDNASDTITVLLQEAQEQQERNVHELQKLNDWDSLWSWFNLSAWFRWLRIAVIVVASLILLRIVMYIINVLKLLRQGYLPLPFKTPIPSNREPGVPEEEGTEGGKPDRSRWRTSPQGFFAIIWEDLNSLLSYSYQTLRNLVWLSWDLLKRLKATTQQAAQATYAYLRIKFTAAVATIQYGFSEIQAAWGDCVTALARFTWRWTSGVLAAARWAVQAIAAIPRRTRQGLEYCLA
ncbi:env protein [Simian immunodeficiency virus]|uniref:Envelope glycoprotein gp160 n=1 Tax=Simian immunodeficiency virus TaxID=11723 RepID=Q1XE72_SIV|nr:env protein [Simian immunodeficiency virus]